MAQKQQIKSKERVADHGEVFTNEREVNAMLDLVKQETDRLDSRFLEPACGDGNFLAEILRRKLAVAESASKGSRHEFEKNSLIALMSIYGVELLEDNAIECRNRMYNIWNEAYSKTMKTDANDSVRYVARFLLSRNILCGNALTLMRVDSQGKDTDQPIIFSEWSLTTGDFVKRRDYKLSILLKKEDFTKKPLQESLFNFMSDEGKLDNDSSDWMPDEETGESIPKPIKEYVAKEYWRLSEDGE